MKKSGFFIIALMFLAGFMVFGNTTTTQASEGEHKIVIGVSSGNQFNQTEFKLEKGVNYTIVFVNTDIDVWHNLKIDVNQDIEDKANANDAEDILIGENEANQDAGLGTAEGKVWTGYWVTPNEDTDITFYCEPHFSLGMKGTFVIGEGAPKGFLPGFSFFFAISALFITATSITVLKKRN